MKTTYKYVPSRLEYYTRQKGLALYANDLCQLAKAPAGGKGLPRRFAWVQSMQGEFLGMVLRDSLVKLHKNHAPAKPIKPCATDWYAYPCE